MSGKSAASGKLAVQWSLGAQKSFVQTIARINAQDAHTAAVLRQRVEKVIDLLATQPAIGTSVAGGAARRFPIPHTGHTIEYMVVDGKLKITRWYRQAQLQRR